jgi:peptidase E
MKLYLFGGYERKLNQFDTLHGLIGEQLESINPKQILDMPFAQLKKAFNKRHQLIVDFYTRNFSLKCEFLNAAKAEDLHKAKQPAILIQGGPSNTRLLEHINSNSKLLHLIQNSENILGESAGAMVLGEYLRELVEGGPIIPGLNILPDTIIEPHYTERNRQQLLIDEIGQTGVKYGIGLDCCTGIILDRDQFPNKYQKVGNGIIKIITKG